VAFSPIQPITGLWTKFQEEVGMMIGTGRDESSVGVGLLDCDHREMAEAFKELNAELATGWNHSQARYVLRSLAKFTLIHFALEEGMMEATKYPGLALHRAAHQRLMEQLNALVSRHNRDGVAPDRQCLSLLPVSHETHIQSDDLNYGRWLNGL
jgi:hemerythrin